MPTMPDERSRGAATRTELPIGTVTFLFTDIEGSTRLAQRLDPAVFREVLELHNSILRSAFHAHGGVERGTQGDSFLVVFTDAAAAVAAAVDAQRALATASWPADVEVGVRMGLHSGTAIAGGDDYVGIDVNRAARIAAAGSGGQVIISDAARALAEGALPDGVSTRDLGIHRFKDLTRPERLFELVIAGLQASFPPLRSIELKRGNLPPRLTSFIGREQERADVAAMLSTSRLVTITGPGGTGKTSLALAVAEDLVDAYADGVWFVPLDGISDPDLIPGAVVHGLGLDIEDRRPAMDRLADYLRDRVALIVIDNFEHLERGTEYVRSMLMAAPGMRALVASQVPLHIGGEREFPLGPLSVGIDAHTDAAADGATDGPAIRLFLDRAREVRPGFALDDSNRGAVTRLCARLDGLPLAVELAAAQVRLLSPSAILDRLAGRIDLLASRRSDLPDRQRTLDGAVAWSYDLLSGDEKTLLRRLSVFAGGCGLEELEQLVGHLEVGADPLAALAGLVDRSLVQLRPTPADRYALLETIRAFAAARLRDQGEEAVAQRWHAELYAQLAERAEPELYRSGRRAWLDRLGAEHDNIRAALDRMEAAGEYEVAVRMIAALWRFWQLTGHLAEAQPRVERLLTLADSSDVRLSPVLLSRAEEAAGGMGYWQRMGDIELIKRHYERSLEYAHAAGDRDRVAWATYNLSFTYDYVPLSVQGGRPDRMRAAELRAEALQVFREVGDARGVGYTLWSMGGSPSAIAEEPEMLRERLAESLVLFRATDEAYGETWALMSLALVEAVTGRFDAAREAIAAAAALFVRDGDVSGQITILDQLAALAARGGDAALAVRIDAAGMAARRATGGAVPPIPPLRGPIAAAREQLDEAQIEREEEAGRHLSFDALLESAIVGSRGPAQAIIDFEAKAAAPSGGQPPQS